jgi:CHAT domain-containing protein/tetratricopeptide (TPR) repeat protein
LFLFSRGPRLNLIVLLTFLGAIISPLKLEAISPPSPAKEKTWVEVGRDLLEKGEYELAIAHFSKRVGVAGTGDRDQVEIYRYLAISYWYADHRPEALESCRRALELATSLGDSKGVSAIQADFAIQEQYSHALELRVKADLVGSNLCFEEAQRISCISGSVYYGPKLLKTWSFNYLGFPDTRKKYLDMNVQAQNLALSLNFKLEACRAAYNVGSYYAVNSDYSHALSYYLRALYFIRDLKPSDDTLKCLSNIAGIYMSLGDFARAFDYISDAIRHNDSKNQGPLQSSLLINLGQTFQALAKNFQDPEYYSRAMECFKAYLNLIISEGGTNLRLHALNGMAGIYVDQGRLEEAKALLLPALDKVQTGKASAFSGMIVLNLAAIALMNGEVADAERYYHVARASAQQNDEVIQLIRAATGLGRCSELRNDYGQAIAFYTEALGVINSAGSRIANDTSRAEFISRSREPFQALVELCYKLSGKGPPGTFERELYRVSESYRARSFMEYLTKRTRRKDALPPDDAGGFNVDKLNGERLTLLKELSRGARNQAGNEELQSSIKHIDDMLDAAVFDKQLQDDPTTALTIPVSLNTLQNSLLSDRMALVEYLLGDERSYMICVTRNSFNLVALPPAPSIQDSLTAYLSYLEDPSIPASKGLPAARRLYAELLLPTEGFIPASVDHLIIVPDGILFCLPFETLALPGAGPSSTVRYLNDRYVISYAPSASALFYLARKPKTPYLKEVLAFGVPESPRPGRGARAAGAYSAASVLDELYKRNGFVMAPIPHARREMTGLAKRVPPGKADLYSGDKATEGAFKRLDLEAYRLIHLACHAFSDDRYPLRSTLVLSAGSDDAEDGFLQVSEMYDLRTNADLVVLSACQTGRGKIVQNEGILGLPRIFFYMGAKSVISTLWPVHDKAGAAFMDYFYDAYFQGASKAGALQIAKWKMAGTKYGHPYYWASYTLTGEF